MAPTIQRARAAVANLSSGGAARDMWIYGRALAGLSSGEIASQLNCSLRWTPERASCWSGEMVRQRIRYARRALRIELGIEDPRSYAGCGMDPKRAAKHRRMYRALRAEAATLDGLIMRALAAND